MSRISSGASIVQCVSRSVGESREKTKRAFTSVFEGGEMCSGGICRREDTSERSGHVEII